MVFLDHMVALFLIFEQSPYFFPFNLWFHWFEPSFFFLISLAKGLSISFLFVKSQLLVSPSVLLLFGCHGNPRSIEAWVFQWLLFVGTTLSPPAPLPNWDGDTMRGSLQHYLRVGKERRGSRDQQNNVAAAPRVATLPRVLRVLSQPSFLDGC